MIGILDSDTQYIIDLEESIWEMTAQIDELIKENERLKLQIAQLEKPDEL